MDASALSSQGSSVILGFIMSPLHTLVHPSLQSTSGRIAERIATRAIVLQGFEILMLYTRRYNDYSFPGGGVDSNEDLMACLQRELEEETGAKGIKIMHYYGHVDEYRPHHKSDFDLLFMRSHFYVCRADRELGTAAMESYEVANGMTALWLDIRQAIAHNEQVIANNASSMGLSIQRETLMLKHVAKDILRIG
jgi:8-oxo-dGTP pyrophosphatase MutT (NUDIX family)